ncbi:hypothetical protein KAU11_08755 [Candidatus Babeliales bacterium]|nr:hypothetical protein [Candidatus Babeliales bacterium]
MKKKSFKIDGIEVIHLGTKYIDLDKYLAEKRKGAVRRWFSILIGNLKIDLINQRKSIAATARLKSIWMRSRRNITNSTVAIMTKKIRNKTRMWGKKLLETLCEQMMTNYLMLAGFSSLKQKNIKSISLRILLKEYIKTGIKRIYKDRC